MRFFEITNIVEEFPRLWTFERLIAVMAWPNDELQRKLYLANRIAHIRVEEDRWPCMTDDSRETFHAYLKKWLDEVGGERSLAAASSTEHFEALIEKRHQPWILVGTVVIFIRQMAEHHAHEIKGGASVKKALEIIGRLNEPLLFPTNEKYRKDAWSMYRPVAHFCAALCLLIHNYIRPLDTDSNSPEFREQLACLFPALLFESFEEFLGIAENFQTFGLSQKPPQAKAETLLRSDELWHLLPGSRMWKRMGIDMQPLPDELLAIVFNYKTSKKH
jgi:hypothetical protein